MTESELEVEENPPEAEQGAAESAVSQDESLARERGWKPRSEWVGDIPPSFLDDPAEYNRQHENVNARLKHEILQLREDQGRFEERFQQAFKTVENRHKQELDRERSRLFDEMRSSAEAADTDRFDRAKKDFEVLDQARAATPAQTEAATTYHPDRDPSFRSWHSDNPWYGKDIRKSHFAERVAAQEALDRGLTPQRDGRAYYDAISRIVEETFGEMKMAAPRVTEGASSGSQQRSRQSKFHLLPAEFKKDFGWLSKKGLYKDDAKGREEYAESVYEENPELFKKAS